MAVYFNNVFSRNINGSNALLKSFLWGSFLLAFMPVQLWSTSAKALTINADGTYTTSTSYDIGVDNITAIIDANITVADFPDGADGGPNNGGFGGFLFDTNDRNNLNITFAAGRTMLSATGGDGGDGLNSAGGNASRGGYSLYIQNSTNSIFTIDSIIYGGNGGNGGLGNGANNIGGNGAVGTPGAQSQGAGNQFIINGSLYGGNGGNGGSSAGTGANGNAASGGSGLSATNVSSIVVNNGAVLQGGNAGNPGSNSSGTAGTSSAGGNGISATNVTSITINAGATLRGGASVSGSDGNGLYTIGTALTSLINSGTIEGGDNGNGHSIFTNSPITTFTNNTTGVIGLTAGAADALNVNSTITNFNNYGTIRTGSGDGIEITAGDAITNFVNTGTISSSSGNGMLVGNNLTDFSNSGTISSGSSVAINFTGGTIDNTLTNTGGTISSGNSSLSSGTIRYSVAFNGKTFTGGSVVNTAGGNAFYSPSGQTSAFTIQDVAITGHVAGGAGNQIYTLAGTTSLNGNIDLGAGTNTVNINGAITGNSSMFIGATSGGTLAMTVGSTGSLALNSTQASSNNITSLTNNGGISIAAGKSLSVAAMTAGSAGNTWSFGIDANNNPAQFLVTGGAVNFTNSTISINASTLTSYVSNGTDVMIADGVGAATLGAQEGALLNDNSLIANYRLRRGDHSSVSAAGADSSNVFVEIERVLLADLGVRPWLQSVGDVFEQIGETGDETLYAVQAQLLSATTSDEISNILEQLTPNSHVPVAQASLAITKSIGLSIDNRLSTVRGLSAAADELSNRFWMEAFGSASEQGARSGLNGYSAQASGVSVGFDTDKIASNTAGNTVLGAAITYGTGQVKLDSIASASTDIENILFTVYGEYALTPKTQGLLVASLGHGWNDTKRSVLAQPVTGDYDSNHYALGGRLSHRFASLDHGFAFIPAIVANYSYISTEDYAETGPAALNIQGSNSHKLDVGLETEWKWDISTESGAKIQPSLKAGYRYDVLDDQSATQASFAGVTSANIFQVDSVNAGQGTAMLGAGFRLYTVDNLEFTAGYSVERKAGFVGHEGRIRAGWRF